MDKKIRRVRMGTSGISKKDEGLMVDLADRISSVSAIRDIRNDCYRHLEKTGFPGPRHEEYRHTPLARTLDKLDLTLRQPAAPPVAPDSYTIPGLDAAALVFVNGRFDPDHSTAGTMEGITIEPLATALEHGRGTGHFGRIADYRKDAFLAWNTLAWDNGVYIEVKDNAVIEKPLVIYQVTNGADQHVAVSNRNLFVVGKNARLTVIQKYKSEGPLPQYLNTVTEAFVADNSRLDLYSLQDDTGKQVQFNHTEIHQKNNSRVSSYVFTLQGSVVRNNLGLAIDGEGCESHMYGLYLLNGDTLTDNHTVADHLKPNSVSNELYKGVMDDRSRGVFNGKIYVRPNAQKTNAFQSNRNILLSDDAKVNTKPQLEIWADDVKCSHGCTTGQLDEEALFYLRTRGIPKATARAMLLYAFAGELIDAVPLPGVKQYLARIIRERLQSA